MDTEVELPVRKKRRMFKNPLARFFTGADAHENKMGETAAPAYVTRSSNASKPGQKFGGIRKSLLKFVGKLFKPAHMKTCRATDEQCQKSAVAEEVVTEEERHSSLMKAVQPCIATADANEEVMEDVSPQGSTASESIAATISHSAMPSKKETENTASNSMTTLMVDAGDLNDSMYPRIEQVIEDAEHNMRMVADSAAVSHSNSASDMVKTVEKQMDQNISSSSSCEMNLKFELDGEQLYEGVEYSGAIRKVSEAEWYQNADIAMEPWDDERLLMWFDSDETEPWTNPALGETDKNCLANAIHNCLLDLDEYELNMCFTVYDDESDKSMESSAVLEADSEEQLKQQNE